MVKTRLGLPANVVAAAMYIVALFGGNTLVAPLLLAGYILLFEDLNFVRRAAVKALAVVLGVLLVNMVLYLIPNFLMNVIENMLNMFDESMYGEFTNWLNDFTGMLSGLLDIGEKVALTLLAVMALFRKSIDLKCLNKLADK